MELNILIFKNIKIDAFTTPQFIDIEPEKAAVQLGRSIRLEPKKAEPYKNLELYHLGTFDDETGIITQLLEPVKILDCAAIYKEVVDNVSLDETCGNEKATA